MKTDINKLIADTILLLFLIISVFLVGRAGIHNTKGYNNQVCRITTTNNCGGE